MIMLRLCADGFYMIVLFILKCSYVLFVIRCETNPTVVSMMSSNNFTDTSSPSSQPSSQCSFINTLLKSFEFGANSVLGC